MRHIGKAGAGLNGAVAAVGLDQAHDHLHQGGLARTVATHKGGTRAGFYGKVHAGKQRALSVLKVDVFKCNKGRSGSHGAAYSVVRAEPPSAGGSQSRICIFIEPSRRYVTAYGTIDPP